MTINNLRAVRHLGVTMFFSFNALFVAAQQKNSAMQTTTTEVKAEAATQKIAQKYRDDEKAHGGFEWKPWNKSDSRILAFVYERDHSIKETVSSTKYIDFATADVDHDGKVDILIYNWDDCTADGCSFSVYYADKNRKPAYYNGHFLRPYKKGVKLDGHYFSTI